MIPKHVYRSSVFSEFSSDEKSEFFSMSDKKVVNHIDNLYYSISIRGDKVVKGGEFQREEIRNMIARLGELKAEAKADYNATVSLLDLNVERAGYSIYEYRLSCVENYDIFISSYIPSDSTPRVMVQLRSRFLVLYGEDYAINESFSKAKELLNFFSLAPDSVRVNRIDYAYHTNLLQNPGETLGTDQLKKHCSSKLCKFHQVGEIGDELEISYLALGSRLANNVFFRAYDKSKEVVEMGYKSFFLDRWLEYGLISNYDYSVYCFAYAQKSYTVGLLVGRIKWYLEHGKNSELKESLGNLLASCYERNTNPDAIRKRIKGVLPDVTKITNVEFETRRKFYYSLDSFFESIHIKDYDGLPALYDLKRILLLRQSIHVYLTHQMVRFVEDRKDRHSPFCGWWERIAHHRIAKIPGFGMRRAYNRNPDLLRAVKSVGGSIALLSMYINKSTAERDFVEDLSDVLSLLNDNHFRGFIPDEESGELILHAPPGYSEARRRKAHQNRAIIEKMVSGEE